jgi:hypothetical protein
MRCSIGPPIGAWLAIVSVALPLSPARAQTSGSSIKALEMVRTETVPIIDGRLDDAVWATAAVVTDLHQLDPVEYSEPSDRSEFYILYDDDALYGANVGQPAR